MAKSRKLKPALLADAKTNFKAHLNTLVKGGIDVNTALDLMMSDLDSYLESAYNFGKTHK